MMFRPEGEQIKKTVVYQPMPIEPVNADFLVFIFCNFQLLTNFKGFTWIPNF
jgi:hypothetical protein